MLEHPYGEGDFLLKHIVSSEVIFDIYISQYVISGARGEM